MAYYLSRSKLRAWRSELEKILVVVIDEGKELEFESDSIEDMQRSAYQMREALKCTEAFPDEFGGRYVGLCKRVVVKQVMEEKKLIVKLRDNYRGKVSHTVLSEASNERTALSTLFGYPGSIYSNDFRPSAAFDQTIFIGMARERGWKIEPDWISRRADGTIEFSAERIVEDGAKIESDFTNPGDVLRKRFERGDA